MKNTLFFSLFLFVVTSVFGQRQEIDTRIYITPEFTFGMIGMDKSEYNNYLNSRYNIKFPSTTTYGFGIQANTKKSYGAIHWNKLYHSPQKFSSSKFYLKGYSFLFKGGFSFFPMTKKFDLNVGGMLGFSGIKTNRTNSPIEWSGKDMGINGGFFIKPVVRVNNVSASLNIAYMIDFTKGQWSGQMPTQTINMVTKPIAGIKTSAFFFELGIGYTFIFSEDMKPINENNTSSSGR